MNEAKLLVDRGIIYYISEERYVLKKLLLYTNLMYIMFTKVAFTFFIAVHAKMKLMKT